MTRRNEDYLIYNKQFFGEWFIPKMKFSDKKIPGICDYKNGQIHLQLLRPLPFDGKKGKRYTHLDYEIVLGDTNLGKVTLTKVIFSGFPLLGSIYWAFIGKHILEEPKVNNLTFNFDILNKWAISNIKHSQVNLTQISPFEKLSFTFDGVECSLSMGVGQSSGIDGTSTYNLSNFSLKSKNLQNTYELFVNFVLGIKYFLMLSVGSGINLTNLRTNYGKKRVEIYIPTEKHDVYQSQFYYFFDIRNLRDNYSEIMEKWFDFFFQNKVIVRSFCDTMHTKYVNQRDFFEYASFLDGLFKSKKLKIKKHTRNQYLDRITTLLEPFCDDFSNMPEFIEHVDQMRHHTFHRNKRDSIDESLLTRITSDLFYLIRLLVINHVGITLTVNDLGYRASFNFLKINEISNNNNLEDSSVLN